MEEELIFIDVKYCNFTEAFFNYRLQCFLVSRQWEYFTFRFGIPNNFAHRSFFPFQTSWKNVGIDVGNINMRIINLYNRM